MQNRINLTSYFQIAISLERFVKSMRLMRQKFQKWDIFGNFQTLWMDTFRWPPKSQFFSVVSAHLQKIVIVRAVWGPKKNEIAVSKGLLHQVLQNCKSTRTTMQIRMWRWWWTMHCMSMQFLDFLRGVTWFKKMFEN